MPSATSGSVRRTAGARRPLARAPRIRQRRDRRRADVASRRRYHARRRHSLDRARGRHHGRRATHGPLCRPRGHQRGRELRRRALTHRAQPEPLGSLAWDGPATVTESLQVTVFAAALCEPARRHASRPGLEAANANLMGQVLLTWDDDVATAMRYRRDRRAGYREVAAVWEPRQGRNGRNTALAAPFHHSVRHCYGSPVSEAAPDNEARRITTQGSRPGALQGGGSSSSPIRSTGSPAARRLDEEEAEDLVQETYARATEAG